MWSNSNIEKKVGRHLMELDRERGSSGDESEAAWVNDALGGDHR
jgi:hypothetical protein